MNEIQIIIFKIVALTYKINNYENEAREIMFLIIHNWSRTPLLLSR